MILGDNKADMERETDRRWKKRSNSKTASMVKIEGIKKSFLLKFYKFNINFINKYL